MQLHCIKRIITKLHCICSNKDYKLFVMKSKWIRWNWDFWGITTSMLCAVHCALLPVLATLSALSGKLITHNHWFEVIMILLAIIIASISLLSSYLKRHRDPIPIIIMLSGFIMMLSGHLLLDEIHLHKINAMGGICIAVAHWINWKKLKNQPCKVTSSS